MNKTLSKAELAQKSNSLESIASTKCKHEVNVRLFFGRDCINLQLNEDMEVQEVIDILSDMYGLINKHLGLQLNGEPLMPEKKLKSLAVNHNTEIKAVLYIKDEPLSINIKNQDLLQHKVKIGKLYENVSVQTNSTIRFNTKETQTPYFPLINRSINTPHTKHIQTNPSPAITDKIITVKHYIPYDDIVRYRNEQAVVIQKYIRRFLAQKRILRMKKERDNLLSKKKLKTEMSYELLLDSIKEIMIKRPIILSDDFTKAYGLVADWMKNEKKKIKEEKSGKNKTAAISNLFNKEMECLYFIQKCRMTQRNEKNKLKFLTSGISQNGLKSSYISSPKTFADSETNKKASDFKSIYYQLRNHELENDGRIVILNQVKEFLHSLKSPECTDDIIFLIDRELQMIQLGIDKSFLEGSRKRLEELFLYLSSDPQFSTTSMQLKNQAENSIFYQCKTCKELKPLKKFNIDILKGLSFCSSCTMRKELAHSKVILTPYKEMIEQIQREEIKRGSNEGYINLLQPHSLYYLVQIIWQGRSSISEESDLELLRLIRWDCNLPWSPWNCILLTENEAEIHQAVDNIEKFYKKHFIKMIENKHLQAKIKFADLEELNKRVKHSFPHGNPDKKISITEPLKSSTISEKIKMLQSNSVVKEPISDLVFPRCT